MSKTTTHQLARIDPQNYQHTEGGGAIRPVDNLSLTIGFVILGYP